MSALQTVKTVECQLTRGSTGTVVMERDKKEVRFTVRPHPDLFGQSGDDVVFTLSRDAALALAEALSKP